jgi:hypothetical protein
MASSQISSYQRGNPDWVELESLGNNSTAVVTVLRRKGFADIDAEFSV